MRAEKNFKPANFLSICMIVKNEGAYLREFIEYHKLVGVDKFYIYDNASTDDTKAVLAPYIKSGVVDYTWWPGDKMQLPANNDCLEKHRLDTKWLAFIDADEFLVPVDAGGGIAQFLKSLPKSVAQLHVAWANYGSSGHVQKPEGLVIENFRRRADFSDTYMMGRNYKSIINPRFARGVRCHTASVAGQSVNENLETKNMKKNLFMPKNKIRINHYLTKSREEFDKRYAKGDAISGGKTYHGAEMNSQNMDKTFKLRDLNDVYDYNMEKYVAPLKAKLQ
jgi:glycosyltransferase involved in cell wall biosynthesis